MAKDIALWLGGSTSTDLASWRGAWSLPRVEVYSVKERGDRYYIMYPRSMDDAVKAYREAQEKRPGSFETLLLKALVSADGYNMTLWWQRGVDGWQLQYAYKPGTLPEDDDNYLTQDVEQALPESAGKVMVSVAGIDPARTLSGTNCLALGLPPDNPDVQRAIAFVGGYYAGGRLVKGGIWLKTKLFAGTPKPVGAPAHAWKPPPAAPGAVAVPKPPAAPTLPRHAHEYGGFAHGITPDEINAINRKFGGTTALTGDVSSSLANAARREGFWNKAATLVRDIAGGHKFNDGNKRTAQAVVEELMKRNGITTGVSAEEMKRVIQRVATGELREIDDIAKALRGF
jgi:death-on-curing family protein